MVQESVKQTSIPFRQKKVTQHEFSNAKDSNSAPKLEGLVGKAGVSVIESPTPQKPDSISRLNTGVGNSYIKGKQLLKDFEGDINSSCDKICTVEDDSIELPDEYKTLNILFEKMDSSIRLLALRKKLPTFRNISTQVEKLSKRKFLYSHLAQMKYLLAESIEIERILIQDEKTLCMIPEIKVTLVKDIKSCVVADQSASVSLCKVFQSELLKYFKTHVQDIEIPRAMLPEPFNEGNNFVQKISPKVYVEVPPQEISTEQEVVARASHLSSSFEEHFILKMIPEKENITPPSTVEENKDIVIISEDKPDQQSTSHLTSQIPAETPTKNSSNMLDMLIKTPSLQTPKRCVPSTTEKNYSENDGLVSEPKSVSTVRKSLIYSPSKASEGLSDHAGYKSRSIFGVDTIGSTSTKVRENLETADDVVKNEGSKSSAFPTNLLSIVDTIFFVLRSTDCTLITKQELMHKIIVNNFDIEESGEVEENLQVLEKLVPDWMTKRPSSDGDFLYSIEKDYDRETVRTKLFEAV